MPLARVRYHTLMNKGGYMEPTLPIRQSPSGQKPHRVSFFRPRTILLCLCITALGIPAVGAEAASMPSELPLFSESPSNIPPAIDQAFSSPQMSKRWVRRHRNIGLNPAALEAMKRVRKEAKLGLTLDLLDAGPRTLELDEPEAHRNKATVWHGKLRGEQESEVTLAVRSTKMAGTIVSGQRLYKIEPTEDNRHRLVEIDDDAMPLDHHPLVMGLLLNLPPRSPTSSKPIPLQPERLTRSPRPLRQPQTQSLTCWSSTPRPHERNRADRLR
jgi:peptidyl-Asp metalloendopeptidase